MFEAPSGSGTSPAGPSSGPNPSAHPLSALAALVAQREPSEPDSRAPLGSSAAEPTSAPATQSNPAATAEMAGQTSVPPGTTDSPSDAAEAANPGGGSQPDLSQSGTGNADLDAALQGLDETQRRQLAGMLQSVQAGTASWNDLKQGHRLNGQVADLRRELEALKSARRSTPPPAPEDPAVQQLQTVDAVKAQLRQNTQDIHELERWLMRNPQGGRIGERDVSADTVDARIAQLQRQQTELEDRAGEIARSEAHRSARSRASQQFAQAFPDWTDPDHPDTALARTLQAHETYFAEHEHGDLLAMATAKGLRLMQQELQTRRRPAGTRPSGKVPLGQPHATPSSAPARSAAPGNVLNAALARHRKDADSGSLAAILSATGR